MAGLSDQQYLLTDQYKDASNFKARVQLHKRFSTNRYGWLQWVFDHLNFSPTSQILDVGCGPGTLWLENADRIPQGCRIILSDFSRGMLLDARQNLSVILPHLTYCNMDIQTISFRDSSFDLVIANHMLYHVPDRNKAFSEVYRVLKPDGILFASTTWIPHLQELRELTERVDPSVNEGLFDGFFGLPCQGSRGALEPLRSDSGMVQRLATERCRVTEVLWEQYQALDGCTSRFVPTDPGCVHDRRSRWAYPDHRPDVAEESARTLLGAATLHEIKPYLVMIRDAPDLQAGQSAVRDSARSSPVCAPTIERRRRRTKTLSCLKLVYAPRWRLAFCRTLKT